MRLACWHWASYDREPSLVKCQVTIADRNIISVKYWKILVCLYYAVIKTKIFIHLSSPIFTYHGRLGGFEFWSLNTVFGQIKRWDLLIWEKIKMDIDVCWKKSYIFCPVFKLDSSEYALIKYKYLP